MLRAIEGNSEKAKNERKKARIHISFHILKRFVGPLYTKIYIIYAYEYILYIIVLECIFMHI